MNKGMEKISLLLKIFGSVFLFSLIINHLMNYSGCLTNSKSATPQMITGLFFIPFVGWGKEALIGWERMFLQFLSIEFYS
jgi:hypothetical protein